MQSIDFVLELYSKFSGGFPVAVLNLKGLEVLKLKGNSLSGEIPAEIGKLSNLSTLVLSGNKFVSRIPSTIQKLSELKELHVCDNLLSGVTPQWLFDIKSLKYMDLSGSKLTWNHSVKISPKCMLYQLSLRSCRVAGRIPDWLAKQKSLDNKLVGSLPDSLSRISTLQVLNLRNNSIRGSIPKELSNLSSLRILDLSSNNIVGSIPSELGNLVGMIEKPNCTESATLWFGYSGVSESLQAFEGLVVNWKKSERGLSSLNLDIYCLLDLSGNQLSGEFPDSMLRLKSLNFSYNQLTGMIPRSLGELESAETLDLSHNKLSGKILPSLAKLEQLSTLDLSNNKLEGLIPRGRQMGTMDDPNSYANNSGLCGMQIKVPCTPISPPGHEHSPYIKSDEEKCFVLEGAGIGFLVGLVSTIGTIYAAGYFDRPTPQLRRGYRRPRRRV
ncbi:receptor-like protein 46 [Macadamia integrifolia]|uniref:receptor-like protein 46 n=1 Tax=Macadamia integrifolia TaxID=60698 RepID=UPI001C52A215|nr:receptor-like protein 46 [Macadamia integrifolia]